MHLFTYPSYTESQEIWPYINIEITCLKELLVTLEIIRTHRVQDIVSVRYVAARKLPDVVDSPVKLWPFMLFSKNCHLTNLCLSHHFGTILTIFAKSKNYVVVDKWAITIQHSRNKELCHFPIFIEKYGIPQLLWYESHYS